MTVTDVRTTRSRPFLRLLWLSETDCYYDCYQKYPKQTVFRTAIRTVIWITRSRLLSGLLLGPKSDCYQDYPKKIIIKTVIRNCIITVIMTVIRTTRIRLLLGLLLGLLAADCYQNLYQDCFQDYPKQTVIRSTRRRLSLRLIKICRNRQLLGLSFGQS